MQVIHKVNKKAKDDKKSIQTSRRTIFANDSKGYIPNNTRVKPNSKAFNKNSSKFADESSIRVFYF